MTERTRGMFYALRTCCNFLFFFSLIKMGLSLLYLCTPHLHLKDMFKYPKSEPEPSWWWLFFLEATTCGTYTWHNPTFRSCSVSATECLLSKQNLRGGTMSWPSLQPDLSPLELFLSPGLGGDEKGKLHLLKVESLQQFIRRLLEAIGTYVYFTQVTFCPNGSNWVRGGRILCYKRSSYRNNTTLHPNTLISKS
jgi:hypothetical protein